MDEKVVKKTLYGKVVSDKMDKTIVVDIERLKKHPVYKKYLRINKKFKAHDENNEAKEGDRVKIEECRPMSKEKSFKLVEIVEKSRA